MTKRVLWFTMAPALLLADVATARASAVPLAAAVVLTQQRRPIWVDHCRRLTAEAAVRPKCPYVVS